MKSFLHNKLFNLAIVTTLVTTVFSITAPATAIETTPIPNNSINSIYPREPNFFTRGREEFEREIQLLLNRSPSTPEIPLKISPKQEQIQEQLAPLENRPQSQELENQNQLEVEF
ncbi:hypothetical protein I8748_26710 [Nostoc sp. CENA67]|uniref:Uncharacterized protein n=1 Tax=Amazonocrinis nigriterrae CENA67 TaxID=2794033 RepID=A0A8J7HU21_9NOST|nr:hypothetical protein [Amazonocrinis nigriterrae]MBH8565722.1 hypothetical protein [Amazonocrinis nigriterrae CENA67]